MFGNNGYTSNLELITDVLTCRLNSDNQIRWKFTKHAISIDDFVHVHWYDLGIESIVFYEFQKRS